ncbi:hypothetical protein ACFQ67_15505 [Streptomyces sp. NPDC056488]|uniref:hypothetical protein n=1 Tax=unclassified Streptomyces TaxID=2593676 RepID=UPI0036C0E781
MVHEGEEPLHVVISTIGGLQLFAQPFLFDQQGNAEGGAEHQFQTSTLMLYEYGFINNDAGHASAVSNVLLSSLAGFAFAELRFRGRDALLVCVVVTVMVPTQLGIIPLYILVTDLGM